MQKFYYSIRLLARLIFPTALSPIDTMFTEILKDPLMEAMDNKSILSEKNQTPRFNSESAELLQRDCMEIYRR